jgi:hypothetical protein
MDTWLKGGPLWPKSPVAKVSLSPDGVPVLTVTADRPAEVKGVAIYYAVANPRPVSRNWRNATPTRSGDRWQAELPVLDTEARLFAFANVRYTSGVHLSSNEEAVIPSALGAARATDKVSAMLYGGSDGAGMWTTGSPCTDPVPPGQIPVPIRPATGPGGKAGFTVNSYAAPMTYQPGDPKWRAPESAGLRFKVATITGETFRVVLHENYSWPGQKTYEADVSLEGQPGWQTVTLFLADFREKKQGGPVGQAPPGFARCEVLQFSGPWKDKDIVFTDVRWVTE